MAVNRNLIARAWAPRPSDCSCTWLILTEAQLYYAAAGGDLEAPVKGGGIQKLDSVHGRRESVTLSHPALSKLAPDWA